VYQVHTPNGTFAADHVVFATDPHAASAILTAGGTTDPGLIKTLDGFEYVSLPISMQKDGSCWMPPSEANWEPVNTLVDGNGVTFTAWFGRLRQTYDLVKRIPVFKSWGAPDVGGCQYEFLAHKHFIPLPTTAFMEYRAVLQTFQGKNNLWFVGGWTTWFDSQEAALQSATHIADAIPGEPKAATGKARLVATDPLKNERNLRALAERIARVAPPDQRARITDVIERVKAEG
jgi:predicted NAD/FAD-binding protein